MNNESSVSPRICKNIVYKHLLNRIVIQTFLNLKQKLITAIFSFFWFACVTLILPCIFTSTMQLNLFEILSTSTLIVVYTLELLFVLYVLDKFGQDLDWTATYIVKCCQNYIQYRVLLNSLCKHFEKLFEMEILFEFEAILCFITGLIIDPRFEKNQDCKMVILMQFDLHVCISLEIIASGVILMFYHRLFADEMNTQSYIAGYLTKTKQKQNLT